MRICSRQKQERAINPVQKVDAIPSFTLVVPTHNRPDLLALCLQGIVQLDYPKERFRVIIVDDGGSADLSPSIAPFDDMLCIDLLRQPNQGPASARNYGAKSAKSDFVAFIDDDCVPTQSWLRIISAHLTNIPDALVGGCVENALPHNPFSAVSQSILSYIYQAEEVKGKESKGRQTQFLASSNIALALPLFNRVGGFNEEFPLAAGEDREFCDRWLAEGYSIQQAEKAKILHLHRMTLRSFWQQNANYGRGAFYVHQQRRQGYAKSEERTVIAAAQFYIGLLLHPLWLRESLQKRILYTLLAILSQAAVAFGFIQEIAQQHEGNR